MDPRFPAGLPFPVPEVLEFVAFGDSGKIFQQFSRNFPGTFLQNSCKDPRNSHNLLEFSAKDNKRKKLEETNAAEKKAGRARSAEVLPTVALRLWPCFQPQTRSPTHGQTHILLNPNTMRIDLGALPDPPNPQKNPVNPDLASLSGCLGLSGSLFSYIDYQRKLHLRD